MKYFVSEIISKNISRTPDGFLVCPGVPIARTGEQVYGAHETPLEPGPDGLVRVQRDEEHVFHPKTIASFEGKPITIQHPEEFVGPKNWAQLAKGTLQNVRRGKGEYNDSLIADLIIMDAEAIELVESGELREVSCGYEADYEQDEDEPGFGRQTKIVGNHLALVDQGRAGSAYAIKDHKTGKVHMSKKKTDTKKKWTDKISSIFGKAQADAHKVIDEAMGEEAEDSDGEQTKPNSQTGEPAKAIDAEALQGMMKDFKGMCDAMMEKFGAAAKGKADDADGDDEEAEGQEKPAKKPAKKKEESADEGESALEDRLKALEAKVEKLVAAMGDDEEGDEETGDEEIETGDEDEEAEDDDFESSSMVGDAANDTASRAEILAPGIKMGKDVKERALKAAYSTKDGERILKSINGGKAPTYDNKAKVEMLFTAASELMKAERVRANAKTKGSKAMDSGMENGSNYKSPEQLNEAAAKVWANR